MAVRTDVGYRKLAHVPVRDSSSGGVPTRSSSPESSSSTPAGYQALGPQKQLDDFKTTPNVFAFRTRTQDVDWDRRISIHDIQIQELWVLRICTNNKNLTGRSLGYMRISHNPQGATGKNVYVYMLSSVSSKCHQRSHQRFVLGHTFSYLQFSL